MNYIKTWRGEPFQTLSRRGEPNDSNLSELCFEKLPEGLFPNSASIS